MALPPEPPKPPEAQLARTVATRIWDAVKKLTTITLHLETLEKEDARLQSQLVELSRTIIDLSNDVSDMIGQMKGIETRLEDKDKLVETVIKLRIMEELQKLKEEFRRN